MPTMKINGEDVAIPPYPHHKHGFYRMHEFLFSKPGLNYIKLDNYAIVREALLGVKHRCTMSRIMLLDPTNACNLRCKGCWAADYDKAENLSYDVMSDLVTQAKALGVRDVLMTGGEPMVRRDDVLRLAREHGEMSFLAFTNGTLIDERVADETAAISNLSYLFSVEGFREYTDDRRGEGVYDKIIRAMALLKERDIAFGISACYTAKNYQSVVSDAFLDEMRERGAWVAFLFNYVPVGAGADMELVCSPEQRHATMERAFAYAMKHDFTIFDYMNLGHAIYGCVAASNGFFHINAHGDVEPCAFCHYADSNIHDMPLVDALRSPFFYRFRQSQPFSDNPLLTCPLMDVPEAITAITEDCDVHSTHYHNPESVSDLTAKTKAVAGRWSAYVKDVGKLIPPERVKLYRFCCNAKRRLYRVTDGRRKPARTTKPAATESKGA